MSFHETPIGRWAEFIDIEALLKLKLLSIRGIEVTQGIQHYRADEHLTDVNDRGADNSVNAVAEKPAWIRVYVRALIAPTNGVTGTLRVHRRSHGFLWSQVAELSPQPPGTVTAEASIDYATERGIIANTLNFVVPAELMCGNLRFTVEVSSGERVASRTVNVDATLRQTLRMRIVPVSYDGIDGAGNPLALPAPTLAEAQATAAWSLLVYPVRSTPDITFTSEVELTFPLTGSPANPGGCAQSWINLNQLIAQARTADGNQPNTFYYGLVPAAVPIGANSGCASSGVTSGRVGGQVTMAHEFGHALGFPHAPCGNVGSGDPNFPAYEPYDPSGSPGASLGEYGLDISTGDVKSPATVRDYMSYCGPRWISLFNYQRSLNHATLRPVTVCDDRPWLGWDDILVDDWWRLRRPPLPDPPPWFEEVVNPVIDRQPVVSIIGVRHLTGRLEVRSVTRTVAVPEVEGAERTDLVAELLDEEGNVLSAGAVMRLTGHGQSGCGGCNDDERGPHLFQAFVPDAGRGARLRITEGDEERWESVAPSKELPAPTLSAKVSKKGTLSLRWKVGKADRPVETWIRWRAEREDEPQLLFIGSGAGQREMTTNRLPSGQVVLDVVAHDGFSRAASREVTVEVPERSPTVAILHPYDLRTLQSGRTLRLQGLATEPGGESVHPERCVWQIDGIEVARGLDVFATAPDAGEHEVSLTAEGTGGTGRARTRLTTVDPQRNAGTGAPPDGARE